MLLNITHETTYSYDPPVPYGLQQLRLVPKSRDFQTVHNWEVEILGGMTEVEFEDHHANTVRLVSFDPDQQSVKIRCHGQVETKDVAGIVGKHGGYTPLWLFKRDTDLSKAGPTIKTLLRESDPGADGGEVPRLHRLSAAIFEAVRYQTGTTESQTTAEEALVEGEGVCQDHAQILIAMARQLGHPARYVSGYLMMNDRVEQDATHAWAEVWLPDLGWLGFDVSNQMSPDARYVRVATGLDYKEAAPISGVRFGTGSETLKVIVQVQQQ